MVAGVSAMTLFIIQVDKLAQQYSSRPVQTSIDVQHEVVSFHTNIIFNMI